MFHVVVFVWCVILLVAALLSYYMSSLNFVHTTTDRMAHGFRAPQWACGMGRAFRDCRHGVPLMGHGGISLPGVMALAMTLTDIQVLTKCQYQKNWLPN